MWCFNNKKSTIKFAPKLLTILGNMSSSNSTDSLTTATLKASALFAEEVESGQQTTKTVTNPPVDIFHEFDTPEIRALTEATWRVHDQFMMEDMRNQRR